MSCLSSRREIAGRQGFLFPLGCLWKQCALTIYSLSHMTGPWGNSRMNWTLHPKMRPWACHFSTSILSVAFCRSQNTTQLLPMWTSQSHLSLHLVLPHIPCVLALQHFGSLMKHDYAYLWAFACALCPTFTQPKLPFKPQLGCYFFKEAFLSGPVLVRDTDPSTGLQWHLLLPCADTYTACNGPLTCLSPSPDSGLWEDRAPI